MASKTDRSTQIRNKPKPAKNQPGNSSANISRSTRINPRNSDIPDPSGLDDTKASAGRIIER